MKSLFCVTNFPCFASQNKAFQVVISFDYLFKTYFFLLLQISMYSMTYGSKRGHCGEESYILNLSFTQFEFWVCHTAPPIDNRSSGTFSNWRENLKAQCFDFLCTNFDLKTLDFCQNIF